MLAQIDPATLKVSKKISQPGILLSVAQLNDSNQVFVGSSDGMVYSLDAMADKPEPLAMEGHQSYVTGLVQSGELLVSGSFDGKLIWWNSQTREQIRTVDAHHKWIRQLAINQDGTMLASVSDDMVCRLWDLADGSLIKELKGHAEKTPHHFPSMLYACAFSADGSLLATADRVGLTIVWEVETGKELARLESPIMYTWDPKQRIHSIGGIRSVAFSADRSLLAVGGTGKINNIDHLEALSRIEIFDWEKGERTHEFNGDTYKGLVEQLIFHPEDQWLLAAGGDHNGFIKFYDLAEKKVIKQDKAPMHVHDLVVNEAFDTIFAAGHGQLVVWQMDAAKSD
jgi:WD40 repeat protein